MSFVTWGQSGKAACTAWSLVAPEFPIVMKCFQYCKPYEFPPMIVFADGIKNKPFTQLITTYRHQSLYWFVLVMTIFPEEQVSTPDYFEDKPLIFSKLFWFLLWQTGNTKWPNILVHTSSCPSIPPNFIFDPDFSFSEEILIIELT